MTNTAVEAFDYLSRDEADALAQTRSLRDGEAWFLEQIIQSLAPPLRPSNTPISDRAFNMIVAFEVTSQAVYQAQYRHPTWPGGASGVTLGIGYDVGYVSESVLKQDWEGTIPEPMIQALISAIGVRGADADHLAQSLRGVVDISWDEAISVHRNKVIPKWISLVEASLANTGLLSPDSLGALVSLTYNRGASFSSSGDRYREMRAIKADMQAKAFSDVPTQMRSMERLWPTVAGLRIRREREAQLFEAGLTTT